MKIRVYYEDTDTAGIVYHANYIKFCERARSELFFKENILPTLGKESTFVVRHIQADFLASATLGEILEVTTKVVKMKHSSLILLQKVFKGDTKLFSMEVVLVYLHAQKPSRIPTPFIEIFEKLKES